MSGLGLGIGLKGLLSSRSAMDVIGHNLSNASTPGYSRQELSVASGRQINLRGLGFGTGVDSQVVNRSIDELLQKRIVEQIGSMNKLDARLDVLRQVESMLGEPGEFGLQAKLESFFTGFGDLSADPTDNVLRSGAVQASDTLASRLRNLSAEVDDLAGNTLGQVRAQVGRVNELTNFVSRLNIDIAQTEATGVPANDMRDQRELALKELGALVDVRYVEDQVGIVRVTVGGQMVVGSEQAYAIEANKNDDGEIELSLVGNDKPLTVRSGALGGLTQANGSGVVGDLGARLDRLAHQVAFEANRLHSTGVPLDGPFRSLTGVHPLTDEDGDGSLTDELLTEAGLPFEVQDGRLYVNVTEEATGITSTHKIDIDASRMTVTDFVAALDDVDRVSAAIDADGRLRINSDGGYGFDFAARLDTAPDPSGTFGGGRPTLGAQADGPYALNPGDTLVLQGLVGPYTVTFQPTDFEDMSQATAEEIAAVINANAGTANNGLQAVVEGDGLFIQGLNSGAGQSLLVAGGTAANATFGWTTPTTVFGSDVASEVTIGGSYNGTDDHVYTFRPMTDGTIGTTPDLMVEVMNENGLVVARLEVGEGYEPGTALEVSDGVTVSFGFGEVSQTNNDRFSLDLISDGDSSDVLVAMGVNALFTGSTASDLAVREDLLRNPERLSVSATGAPGDNGIALALQNLGALGIDGLDGASIGEFWGRVTGDVGFETASTGNAIEVEGQLVASLEARRDQISGVNVDEELVNMIQYEQAFAASSQFIQVVNGLNDDLLSLVR